MVRIENCIRACASLSLENGRWPPPKVSQRKTTRGATWLGIVVTPTTPRTTFLDPRSEQYLPRTSRSSDESEQGPKREIGVISKQRRDRLRSLAPGVLTRPSASAIARRHLHSASMLGGDPQIEGMFFLRFLGDGRGHRREHARPTSILLTSPPGYLEASQLTSIHLFLSAECAS